MEQVENLLREWRLNTRTPKEIAEMMEFIKNRPFYMRCASDAVGWSSNIPGMGFIHESSLPPKSLKLLRRMNHAVVPLPVAKLLQAQRGYGLDENKSVFLQNNRTIWKYH